MTHHDFITRFFRCQEDDTIFHPGAAAPGCYYALLRLLYADRLSRIDQIGVTNPVDLRKVLI